MVQEIKNRYIGRLDSAYEYFERYDMSTEADALESLNHYYEEFVVMLDKMRTFGIINVIDEHELKAFAKGEYEDYVELVAGR